MKSRSKRFAVLYGLAALNGVGATTSFLSLWLHWRVTLSHCANMDCSCILYAAGVYKDLIGGNSYSCKFVTFSPIPVACLAATLAAVHFYWGYIRKRRQATRNEYILVNKGGPQPAVQIRRVPIEAVTHPETFVADRKHVVGRLGVQAVIAFFVSFLLIGHVSILTDGYNVTCREYRQIVMKILDATGNLALMINSRVLCPTVFDFLDYTKPDYYKINGPAHWTPSGKPPWDPGLINTGAAFICALTFSYLQMFLWIFVCVYSAIETWKVRKSQKDSQKSCRRNAVQARGPVMDTAL